MSRSTRRRVGFAALGAGLVALLLALVVAPGRVLQAQRGAVAADGFLTGVVQGPAGPEAGVWVIAETKDLATNFIKIVVTDDQGRFMVPELPAATYNVWVRGYGLVDSKPVQTKPTSTAMTLRVTAAGTPQDAAKVYPGNYWLSMLEPPAKSEFPGTGNPPQGNGLGAAMDSQDRWVYSLKSDCNFCHQLGNQLTRSVDHVFKAKPELKTHAEAWEWRLGTGVRGTSMYSVLNNQGQARSLKVYADWSERIAKGEVPPTPPRPKGVERNLVLTLWDWGTDHSFMHDEVTTDRHHPTVNGGGPVLCGLRRPRRAGDPRPEDEPHRGARHSNTRATREGAVALPEAESSVALVGRHVALVESALQPGRPAQPDARQQGPRVDDVEDPRRSGCGVVQRSQQQIRGVVPAA
jgi:hypothetical protein